MCTSMRIRTDGKHEYRAEIIERAAEFWDCNKTTALMKSVEFTRQMDASVQEILSRNDLTFQQKQEIAQLLTITGTYEIELSEQMDLVVD